MKALTISLLLIALSGLAGCGGSSAPTTPTGPIALTKEQAEAIAQEDSRVRDEEGGAFVAKQKAKAKK